MRTFILLTVGAVVIGAIATGHGSALLSAISRGFGFGIGREVAHTIMRH